MKRSKGETEKGREGERKGGRKGGRVEGRKGGKEGEGKGYIFSLKQHFFTDLSHYRFIVEFGSIIWMYLIDHGFKDMYRFWGDVMEEYKPGPGSYVLVVRTYLLRLITLHTLFFLNLEVDSKFRLTYIINIHLHQIFRFLDASTHKRVCPSVRPSFRQSDRGSVGPSRFF